MDEIIKFLYKDLRFRYVNIINIWDFSGLEKLI